MRLRWQSSSVSRVFELQALLGVSWVRAACAPKPVPTAAARELWGEPFTVSGLWPLSVLPLALINQWSRHTVFSLGSYCVRGLSFACCFLKLSLCHIMWTWPSQNERVRGTEAPWKQLPGPCINGFKFILFLYEVPCASFITIITLRYCHKPVLKTAQKKNPHSSQFVHVKSSHPTVLFQPWLRLCAQACPGLQVSRHRTKPCQPADSSAKPACLLLPSAASLLLGYLLFVQMNKCLRGWSQWSVLGRGRYRRGGGSSSLPLSPAVLVRWCLCPCLQQLLCSGLQLQLFTRWTFVKVRDWAVIPVPFVIPFCAWS